MPNISRDSLAGEEIGLNFEHSKPISKKKADGPKQPGSKNYATLASITNGYGTSMGEQGQ